METISEAYQNFLDQGDPRVSEWPLVRSPVPTLALIASYICFVKVIGPAWMKDRKPYDLRALMVVYNFAMVAYNGYLFLNFGRYGWFGRYNFGCQPVDYSDSFEAIQMAKLGWWFLISKFVEFVDTAFFVLRKKYSHVTPLHLVHHSLVPICVWSGIKFVPGGSNSFFPLLNSLTHTIMYLYYGLAAVGPSLHPYLWWKKYITRIQMSQFMLAFIHDATVWYHNCDYHPVFLGLSLFNSTFFWILFFDFYRTAYRKNKATTSSTSSAQDKKQDNAITTLSGSLTSLRERRPKQQELVHSYVQSCPVAM